MSLSELAGLAGTLDGHGRSAVADAVAATWAMPPGTARFRRSSANHVFVARHPEQPNAEVYLRFVPESWRPRERMVAVAELMRHLGRRAVAVVQPLPSARGRLVEAVATPRGTVLAMVVTAAPGRQLDAGGLPAATARAWGALLARLHRDGADGDPRLPAVFADLDRAAEVLAHDRPLAEAVQRLRSRLDRLPRDADRFGVVHGDFELDNLRWVGSAPTAYDLDEAGWCWFVADIAHALRDVLAAGPAAVATRSAFLAGYRGVRPLPAADLAWLAPLAAVQDAVWLVRLPAVMDRDAGPADPPWLSTLQAKLAEHRDRRRASVLAQAAADW